MNLADDRNIVSRIICSIKVLTVTAGMRIFSGTLCLRKAMRVVAIPTAVISTMVTRKYVDFISQLLLTKKYVVSPIENIT